MTWNIYIFTHVEFFFLVSSEIEPCPQQFVGKMEGREEGRKRGRKEKSAWLFLWYKAHQAVSDSAAVLRKELWKGDTWPVSSSASLLSLHPSQGEWALPSTLGCVQTQWGWFFVTISWEETYGITFCILTVFNKEFWGAAASCYPGAHHGMAWVGKGL